MAGRISATSFFILFVMIVLLSACTPDPIYVGCFVNELIDAIHAANADPDHTLIILEADCSYPLTEIDNDQGAGASGLPFVTTPITIEGNHALIWRRDETTIPEFRIFFIGAAGRLTLNDLTLSYGKQISGPRYNHGGAIFVDGGELTLNASTLENNQAYTGGAIYNRSGTVTLNNSTVTSNQANGGGGISNYSDGTLTLNGSHIIENVAEESGGGIWSSESTVVVRSGSSINSNSAGKFGGGIHFGNGALTIEHSELNYNQAGETGGGLRYWSLSSSLVIERGTFIENTAGLSGGGVRVSAGHFTISNSGFTRNHADLQGGGLYAGADGAINDSSLFFENTALQGGGVYVSSQRVVTMEDCLISNNEATEMGGGIVNWSDLTLINSTIFDNHANEGGGIATAGPLTIIRSTIRENTAAAQGGGIFGLQDSSGNSSVDLLNSTISGNQAPAGAGVIVGWNGKIAFSTITNNVASSAGGLLVNGNLNITNSIVADNQAADCGVSSNGSINLMGETLDKDGSCTDFTITAFPWLGPLADNGGSTYTHALGLLSPAIDAALDCTDTDGNSVSEDQRGESRPYGTNCDLGAYEVQTDQPPLTTFDIPITFRQNVNCRIGPHDDHVVVLTHLDGETATAVGRNRDGTWLAAWVPEHEGEFDEKWCWVPDRFLDRDSDNLNLPILEHLPSPDRLEPKEPTKEPDDSSSCGVTSACP